MSLLGSKQDFATTHWSVVLAAGGTAAPASAAALASLCEIYWYPLYAFVRRRGFDANDAHDLTQAFFAHLLQTEAVGVAQPERGKFRSFLLASLNHFLLNEWRKEQTQKRGGGQALLSLNLATGEERYVAEPSHDVTPEKIFERRWALTLLQQVLESLRNEYVKSSKAELFDHLKDYLGGSADSLPYAELAKKIGMTEGSVKVAVHRLRRRCGDLLREHIAQTVADPADVDEELRHLFSALQI